MPSRCWWGSETTAAFIAGVENKYCLAGSVTSRRNVCEVVNALVGGRMLPYGVKIYNRMMINIIPSIMRIVVHELLECEIGSSTLRCNLKTI